MREIVLDTETTGLEPSQGHRIVEIGAVELVNHMPTGRTFHEYIDPARDMPEEAFAVHGLGMDFLRGKPRFAEVAPRFREFAGDAPLVIHNAAFDMKFLNAEFGWCNLPVLPMNRAVDTLTMARQKYPGAPASLDALCRRFGIDNGARTLHGALLDAEILAEVYLELIGGRQPDFALAAHVPGSRRSQEAGDQAGWRAPARPRPLAPRLTEAERAAHEAFVAQMGDEALWQR